MIVITIYTINTKENQQEKFLMNNGENWMSK